MSVKNLFHYKELCETEQWSEKALDLFISMMKSVNRQKRNYANTREMFHEVQKRMSVRGYDIKVDELENKWQFLRNMYRDQQLKDKAMEPELMKLFDEIVIDIETDEEATALKKPKLEDCVAEHPTGTKAVLWTHKSTKDLLDLLHSYKPNVGKTLPNKKAMWQKITNEMCSQGYTFTLEQVINKWKTMMRRYRMHLYQQQRSNSKHGNKTRFEIVYAKYADLFVLDEESTTLSRRKIDLACFNDSYADEVASNNTTDDEFDYNSKQNAELPDITDFDDIIVEDAAEKQHMPTQHEITVDAPTTSPKATADVADYRAEKLRLQREKIAIKRQKLQAYKQRTTVLTTIGADLLQLLQHVSQK